MNGRAPAWALVAASFALYAIACVLGPWSWAAHPDAWTVARTVPYWVAPGVSALAWALRKDEGPTRKSEPRERFGFAVSRRSRPNPAGDSTGADLPYDSRSAPRQSQPQAREHGAQPNAPDPAAQASRRIAALLAASALVDAIVLLPSLDASTWALASPLAWTTWGAVAVALVMGARRQRVV